VRCSATGRGAIVVAALLAIGCHSPPPAAPGEAPPLPPGDAGRVLARAFDAAGGWPRWQAKRDVAYVSMLTIVDPERELTTDSIGWFAAPLHAGARVRVDSIGLPTEVRFGVDGAETWITSDGQPLVAPGQLALTRFDLVSSLFWFSLPFGLVELPFAVTYDGAETGPDGTRWEKLRAELAHPDPAVPGKWFVLYFDGETGLIDHVFAQLSAPFLRHDLWVGRWLHYREWDGIRKERQRKFFPADESGDVIGALVAEQFVEHVHFDNDYPPAYFDRPPVGLAPATPRAPDAGVAPIAWRRDAR